MKTLRVIALLTLMPLAAHAQEQSMRVADGSDKNGGKTTDALVSGDVNGSISAKLRQINKVITLSWDNVNNRINVNIQNVVAVTQSGAWTVQPGNTANTTPWLFTVNQGGNSATVSASGALKVDNSAVTQPVSGTFWQATQPVSLASVPSHAVTNAGTFAVQAAQSGTWTVQPGNTANTTAWKVDGSAVTQPVSGTVTANAGTNLNTSALALDATLTGGTQKTKIVDTGGANVATVSAAGAVKVDGSAVTQPVSGTVTANQGGTWTVQPGNTANTTAWKVDGSAVTQPVSGTVTANAGTGTFNIQSNAAVNVAQMNGVATTMGNGASGTGVQRVTVASDSTGTTKINDGADTALVSGTGSLQVTCDNCGGSTFADNAAFTFGTSPVLNIGAVVDDTATNTVTENSAGNPRMTTKRQLLTVVSDPTTPTQQMAINSSGQPTIANTAFGITGAIPAGSNVIGHVIADTGSTTAVTGTVTVSDGSGALNVIVDSGTTAVTQATASNLNAQVVGAAASGASKAGNPVQFGGVFNSTQPTVTTGQAVESQSTARGAQIVATGADIFNVTVNAALPAGANVIGALTANQSVNVAQVGAAALSLGQKTMANSIPVVVASDQGTVTTTDVADAAAGAALPSKFMISGGSVTTSAPSYTTSTSNALSLTTGGALRSDNSSIVGTATVTSAAGVQKVGVVGNANGAFDAANNAAAPANVLATGLEVVAQGTQPTAATSLNVRRQIASTEGVAFVQEGNSNRFSCFVVSTATATTQCQAAPGAGLRAYVTSVTITNAVGTAQSVDVVFGTGAACVTGITALTNKLFFIGATQQGSLNASVSFTTPLVPTAANAICLRPTAATAFGGTITGYIAP